METIAIAAHEVQRPVFFARVIIIVSYLPIFTLQRVEGRLFSPMAWTVAFALLGALVFALLIAPVLCSILFSSGIKEWRNPVLEWLNRSYGRSLDWCFDHMKFTLGMGLLALARHALHRDERNHRVGIPSAPRRRRNLGPRNPRTQHRAFRQHRDVEEGSPRTGQLSRK